MNNYCMNYEKNEAHEKAVRQLRLAHASHMQAFDDYLKDGNIEKAGYWLMRARDSHKRLAELGETL